MRIRIIVGITALLLVPSTAGAQTQAPAKPPAKAQAQAPGDVKPVNTGTAEVGVMGTSTTGDAARYERYRDLRDGLFMDNLRITRQDGPWKLSFDGNHVGRKDQKYVGRALNQGKVNAWFGWDQIPMLFSRSTVAIFQGDVPNNAGLLPIADNVQSAGQTSAANIPLLFPSNTQGFQLQTHRHIAEAGVKGMPNSDLTIRGVFRYTTREGIIPYGGSFGHSQLAETTLPTNHQTKDAEAGAEWSHDRLLIRGGYAGSFFHNDFNTLTLDNPWRLVDSTSTPSRGRLSLPPSNSFVAVNGMAALTLPARTHVTFSVTSGVLKDAGDPLMPNTVNTATTGLLPLPRTTVDGRAETMAYNFNFTSRPAKKLQFLVRYRSYDYDNQTPEFGMVQRISYDNAPSNLATPVFTEPFSVLRKNFDADVNFLPFAGATVGVGYGRYEEERSHRIFENTVDDVTRVVFDIVGNKWYSVRTKYEHAQKRGHGFDEEVLIDVAEQTGLRHFDVASRDRNRVTFIGTVTPSPILLFNVTVAAGNDDYLESVMGVRDNNHRIYGAGFAATPRENMSFGATYSHENYLALSRSRQANPSTPTGCVNVFPAPAGQVTCQFYDESRNWAVDSTDGAHSFLLNAEFLQIKNKFDVTLGWDTNRARGTYHYITGPVADRTLPEETPNVPSTLPTPTQLPDVVSNLDRGTVDLVYSLSKRLGLGFSYWYEKYHVEDFALDAEAVPNLATTNAVLIGYLYKPYTANTFFGKLIVRW
jgi:MtrB/PioB family decaheme-associated outer membrane protein